MKKITYVISEIDRAIMFEWVVEMLDPKQFQLSFILMNPGPSYFENYLIDKKIEVHRVRFRGKKDWLACFLAIRNLLGKIRPHTVHTHFLDASLVGLFAARIRSVPQRIYTRHHSNLHRVYFKKGLVFDLLINRLATHVIAISGMVKTILEKWDKLPPEKVVCILHGIHVPDFEAVEEQRILRFKKEHLIGDTDFVIGVISRLTEWKGIQYIIPAFKSFMSKNPSALLIILNAHGDYEPAIRELLKDVPEDRYRLIRFEKDIPAAYKTFHIFAHVPVDPYSEAFGLVYIESLAAKIPSIFTLSGVAPDFVKDRENAVVVPFCDSGSIGQALEELSTNDSLRNKITEQGYKDVTSKFPVSLVISKLAELYNR